MECRSMPPAPEARGKPGVSEAGHGPEGRMADARLKHHG